MNKIILAFLVGLVLNITAVSAGTLVSPTGKVILTISGKLENTNSEHGAQFDLKMLLALQQTVINTNTPWTKGMTKFEGPTLKELLKHVGAIPEEVMATALNGYRIKLPIVDINNYPMIIALKRDDEVLSVRTKGPIWVIYPWSENPEIRDNLYYTRSIWQLQQLDIN